MFIRVIGGSTLERSIQDVINRGYFLIRKDFGEILRKSMWEILNEESEKEEGFFVIRKGLILTTRSSGFGFEVWIYFIHQSHGFRPENFGYRDFLDFFSVVILKFKVLVESSSLQYYNFDRLRSVLDFRSINLSRQKLHLIYDFEAISGAFSHQHDQEYSKMPFVPRNCPNIDRIVRIMDCLSFRSCRCPDIFDFIRSLSYHIFTQIHLSRDF